MQITVFEQNGSGRRKIAGIERYGRGIAIARVIAVDGVFPALIDSPEAYIPEDFGGDLVLDYLTHPDLSCHLISLCTKKGIPVIASGKKNPDALTPFTCCGLGRHKGLGAYGEQFGFPEYRLELDRDGRIAALEVLRGASCGATWEAARKVIGTEMEEAMSKLPREIQYLCCANPSRFDPVSGKSPLHYAGHVHHAALEKAAEQWRSRQLKQVESPLPGFYRQSG